MLQNPEIPIQPVDLSAWKNISETYQLSILRTDLVDNEIQGNKWFKLKYNLAQAKRQNLPILTFGGAFSNHIAATAAAGKKLNIKTIGIIRGEETLPLNPTLQKAVDNNMQLHYISRSDYRCKYSKKVITQLKNRFGNFFLIPEGGSNTLALKGVAEMLTANTQPYNIIALASGTGGTTAGLYKAKAPHQHVISFPVLKNAGWMTNEIAQLLALPPNTQFHKLTIFTDYHFGGYAKINNTLIDFVNQFYNTTNIPLDLVYTGKALYGLFHLIQQHYFPAGTNILFVHTGGLQGNKGMQQRYGVKLNF